MHSKPQGPRQGQGWNSCLWSSSPFSRPHCLRESWVRETWENNCSGIIYLHLPLTRIDCVVSSVITPVVFPLQPLLPAAAWTANRLRVRPRLDVSPAPQTRPKPNSPSALLSPAPISLTSTQPLGAELSALRLLCRSPHAAPAQIPCTPCSSRSHSSSGPSAPTALSRRRCLPRTGCCPGRWIMQVPCPAASCHTFHKIQCPYTVLKALRARCPQSLPSPPSPQVPCTCRPLLPQTFGTVCTWFKCPLEMSPHQKTVSDPHCRVAAPSFLCSSLLHLPEWHFSLTLWYRFTYLFIFRLVFWDASPQTAENFLSYPLARIVLSTCWALSKLLLSEQVILFFLTSLRIFLLSTYIGQAFNLSYILQKISRHLCINLCKPFSSTLSSHINLL